MNALKPDLMTAPERLAEAAAILAAGLVRLRSRRSSGTPAERREFAGLCRPPERSCVPQESGGSTAMMSGSGGKAGGEVAGGSVLARVAGLRTTPTPELKAQWRDLFGTEPPSFNRRYIESRLAYRIQELAYGGLKPETKERLRALGEALDGGDVPTRRTRVDDRPIAGTRLIREWAGVEHTVTVLPYGYEWAGRSYKSLSAVARAITGTRWNGPLFFGLRRAGERKGARS